MLGGRNTWPETKTLHMNMWGLRLNKFRSWVIPIFYVSFFIAANSSPACILYFYWPTAWKLGFNLFEKSNLYEFGLDHIWYKLLFLESKFHCYTFKVAFQNNIQSLILIINFIRKNSLVTPVLQSCMLKIFNSCVTKYY